MDTINLYISPDAAPSGSGPLASLSRALDLLHQRKQQGVPPSIVNK